jgi:putative molybdopterin biosynthesis protein
MKLSPDISWKLGRKNAMPVDSKIIKLLREIQTRGSLKLAAEETGVSYRHAWGLIKDLDSRLETPVVQMQKGRGARLTLLGEKILWADQYTRNRLSRELKLIDDEINEQLSELIDSKHVGKLRINASHGLAITRLYALLQESDQLDIDFHFRGSLESLRELANSRCDIAGFHFPKDPLGKQLTSRYRQWLDPGRHRLIQFATREQGLMVKRGNPHKIKALKDLTRRSLRFINRQEESGTRTILDELLKLEGINSSQINGYRNEEFTHLAVGALIASDTADAGFGIEAAARQFKLEFIPLISETYVLAIDKSTPKHLTEEFIKYLKSRRIKTLVNALPGYNAKYAGKTLTFEELFPG